MAKVYPDPYNWLARQCIDPEKKARLIKRLSGALEREPTLFGCRLWKNAVNNRGYGYFHFWEGGVQYKIYAHIAFFVMREKKNPVPGHHIDHTCGMRHCVVHTQEVTGTRNKELVHERRKARGEKGCGAVRYTG